MKKIIFSFISVLLLCNFVLAYEDNLQRVQSSWIGENIDSIIKIWGFPTKEKTIAKKHLYIWESDRIKKYYGQTAYSSGTSYEVYCDKIVEVDDKNNIAFMQFKGNNCPIMARQAKLIANPDHNYWKEKQELKVQAKLEKQKQKQLKKELKENEE